MTDRVGAIEAGATPRPEAAAAPGRIYTLVVLTLAFAFAYIDRSIVSVLLPAIKREFHVGDAALAFLSGFAFAIFFIVLGIPMAAWADRGNRRRIIALSIAVWSLMTATGGLAGSFLQLVLARVGVGVGESGLTPPAQSLISDLFPRKTRGLALSIYQSGANLGGLLGLALGGFLAQYAGWRGALMIVGIPGVLVALLIQFTIVEPRRGASDAAQTPELEHGNILAVLAHVWRTKPVRYVFLGISLCAMVTQTQGVWLPSFLVRSHHLPIAEVGLLLGLASGVGGAIGVVAGGRLSDALGARDERWRLWIVTVAMLISPVTIFTVLFVQNLAVLVVMSSVTSLLNGVHLAPTLAAIQNLTPSRMRARAVSMVIFVLNLLGLGVGPLIVGVLSDHLRPVFGADSLRYALTPVILFALLAAGAYFAAGVTNDAHEKRVAADGGFRA